MSGGKPCVFSIACHRGINATCALGGYEWGQVRKTAMIAWEGVHSHATT